MCLLGFYERFKISEATNEKHNHFEAYPRRICMFWQKWDRIERGVKHAWDTPGWLFIVLRPAEEFFTDMETSPLPLKGCKT
jgi:hypothetical protein